MKLESFLSGGWCTGAGAGRSLVNPTTGEKIGTADATGLDVASALEYARSKGRALSALGFSERGAILKEVAGILQANRDSYLEIARINSGNTAADASFDVDGAIFTLKSYARLGSGLGDATHLVEPGQDQLARDPVFFARHFWTTRPGVAVQINAFNFPAWGMWEKVAQALLAGVPSFAKPATSTAWLSERMVRDVIDAGILPDGTLSLLCGGADGVIPSLGPMDSVAFTGSGETARLLRREIAEMALPPRLTIEADSVNATIVGPDAAPGTPMFDLAVREATKAISFKAGQLCTNIRRILVPMEHAAPFAEALSGKVAGLAVGDPSDEAVRTGPLINLAQRNEAQSKIELLSGEARVIAQSKLPEVPASSGFVAPTLLLCEDVANARALHDVEVFGPCATILPYTGVDQAVALGALGQGSLALSLFSNDEGVQSRVLSQLAHWHGRILMVDDEAGKSHSGHANVVPNCVHGGPGRAGGGEELGGLRGLRFHMQRTALQASPTAVDALGTGAAEACL